MRTTKKKTIRVTSTKTDRTSKRLFVVRTESNYDFYTTRPKTAMQSPCGDPTCCKPVPTATGKKAGFDPCAEGFESATGLKLKVGELAEIRVVLSRKR